MSADPTENDDSQGPAKELEPVDSEVTPVGGTSKKLLELSEGGDQNTRAYRAPRELLDLARRQRALGFRASAPAEARPSAAPPVPVQSVRLEPPPAQPVQSSHQSPSRHGAPALRPPMVAATPAVTSVSVAKPAMSRPAIASQNPSSQRSTGERPTGPKPTGHRSSVASTGDTDSGEASSQKRRVRPVSLSPSDFSEGEAAPPRPIAESLGPRDRPTRRPGRSEENVEPSGPSISYQPASSRSANSVEALQQGHAAEQEPDSDADPDVDAAPPVARSRPSRALSSEPSSPSPARPAASLADLARAASDRATAPSVPAPSPRSPANDLDAPMPSSLSTNVATTRSRVYLWAFLFVLFIVVGFLLARWRVLDLVLPPAR